MLWDGLVALIDCKECGNKISDQAHACPHCGAPLVPVAPAPIQVQQKVLKKNSGCGTLLVALFALFAVISCWNAVTESEPQDRSPKPSQPDTNAAEKARIVQSAIDMDDEALPADIRLLSATRAMEHPDPATKERATRLAEELREQVRLASVGKQWSYSRHKDPMTGGDSVQAAVHSTNAHDLGFPYSGVQRARLVVRRHPQHGSDIIFSIERGQLLCSTYGDCPVRLRFDEAAPRTLKGNEPADHSTETIFIPGYRDFVTRLSKAKTLLVEINVYQRGAPTWEFDVEGFDPEKMK